MQFIKASERLPKDTANVLLHVQYYVSNFGNKSFCKGTARYFNSKWLLSACREEESITDLEWLDEKSSLPTIEECMEYARRKGITHKWNIIMEQIIEFSQKQKP